MELREVLYSKQRHASAGWHLGPPSAISRHGNLCPTPKKQLSYSPGHRLTSCRHLVLRLAGVVVSDGTLGEETSRQARLARQEAFDRSKKSCSIKLRLLRKDWSEAAAETPSHRKRWFFPD